MQSIDEYIGANEMQHHDFKELFNEFKNELSQMQGKCLDIGCGPGQITKMLLTLLSDKAEIVGADISQEMVNYAQKTYADKRISYIVMDIETLNLSNDQIENYDNVVSFYCLHWCNDIWRAFDNIYKLLRPQGKALVMFLAHHIGFESYMCLKQNPLFQPYLQDAHRYVPYFQKIPFDNVKTNLENILRNIGFKILHCSNREKSFLFTKESLKKHACAINPFIKRFPNENLKEEFLEQLVNQIISYFPLKNDDENYIDMKYYLVVVHVQKPIEV